MEILAVTVGKHDAINRDEHACQTKKNSEGTVPAYEEGSAFRSHVGESLRSPNLISPMGRGGNKSSKRQRDSAHQEIPRRWDENDPTRSQSRIHN
jgi:hypothetical protein